MYYKHDVDGFRSSDLIIYLTLNTSLHFKSNNVKFNKALVIIRFNFSLLLNQHGR